MKIICKQCGKEFELTQSEISFYKSKNLSLPKRCKECRDKNKQQNGQSSEGNSKSAPSKNASAKSTNQDTAKETQNKTYTSKPIKDTKGLSGKTGFFIAAAVIIAAVLFFLFSDNSEVPDTSKVSGSGFSDAISDFVSDMNDQLQSGDNNSMDVPDTTSGTEDPDAAQTSSGTEASDSENEAALSEDTSDSAQPPDTEETQAATQTAAPPESEGESAGEITNDLHFRNAALLEQHYQKHGIEMGFSSAEEYERAAAAVVTDSRALHKTEAEDGDDVYYIEETNEFVIVSTDGYIRTYFNPNRGINYFYDQ